MPAPETTFRISEFGAIGDGETPATFAIQQAIDACASAGGGRVVVPTGRYLTGALRLRADVMLQLTVGATLVAGTDTEQPFTGRMIVADNASRIGIEGRGTIDGRGGAIGLLTGPPSRPPDPLIEFGRCRDVTVRDVRILSSPGDAIVLTRCELATVEGIRIANGGPAARGAGVAVDGGRDVFVRDSLIVGSGDAIRFETGEPDVTVENVIVSGCVLSSDDAALRFGPRSFGTIRHSVFSDLVIRGSRMGVALSMRDGGSFQNLRFSDSTIETGRRLGDPELEAPMAIHIESGPGQASPGTIRSVSLSDIDVTTRGSLFIVGRPDRPIENLSLDRLTVTVRDPADLVRHAGPQGNPADGWPAGVGATESAAHLVMAHVRGMRVSDLRVTVEPPDAGVARRVLWGRDLVDLVLAGVWGRQSGDPASLPAIELIDCRRVILRDSVAAPGTESFLRLTGENTANVHLTGNILGQATRTLVLDHVDRSAVTMDGAPPPGRQR